MANENLESRVSGSFFDSVGSGLTNIVDTVKSIPKVAKDVAYYTYYGGKLALAAGGMTALMMAGGVPAAAALKSTLVTAGGFMAGRGLADKVTKKKSTFKGIANDGAIGAVMGGGLHYLFGGINYAGDAIANAYGKIAGLVSKGAMGLASVSPFTRVHNEVANVLDWDYKRKSGEDLTNKVDDAMGTIGLPVMANMTVVPPYLQIPVAAGIATLYSYLSGTPKEEAEPAPTQGIPQPAVRPT